MKGQWTASEEFAVLDTGNGKAYVYYTDDAWYANDPDGELMHQKFNSMSEAIEAVNKLLGINASYVESELKFGIREYLKKEISRQLSQLEDLYNSLYFASSHFVGLVDKDDQDDIRDMMSDYRKKYLEIRRKRASFNSTFFDSPDE